MSASDHSPRTTDRRDKAQRAADAVLDDLMDRRGIKHELRHVKDEDRETWREIRTTLADIIRRECNV